MIVDTATRALDEVGVKSGETLLVSGAAGGIGSAVLQFARLRGITVIGTASAQKHDYLRGLGAIPTTYGPGLAERVRELAPEGVDAALDLAGSGIIPELIEIVGDPSHVLSVADFSAPQYGAKFSHGPPKDLERVFAEVARLCSEGLFRLRVEQTFPLEQTQRRRKSAPRGTLRASSSFRSLELRYEQSPCRYLCCNRPRRYRHRPHLPYSAATSEDVTHSQNIAPLIGIMAALYALMQFIFAPVLGALSDNLGRRPVLLISLGGAAINYVVMAFAPHLWMLLLGRAHCRRDQRQRLRGDGVHHRHFA